MNIYQLKKKYFNFRKKYISYNNKLPLLQPEKSIKNNKTFN
jgi:hypothetical protein